MLRLYRDAVGRPSRKTPNISASAFLVSLWLAGSLAIFDTA